MASPTNLPPGFALTKTDDGWELISLGPGGTTTTTHKSKEDAEAAIEEIVATREEG